MNWNWRLRSRDGGMNGLEFCNASTAGDLPRILVHAAPAQASLEVVADDGSVIARGNVDRSGDYSPMTLLEIDGDDVRRMEIWPTAEHRGLPVLLCGGEVGVLQFWENAEDRSWWRWSVEFSNHTDQPDSWTPPGQDVQRSTT